MYPQDAQYYCDPVTSVGHPIFPIQNENASCDYPVPFLRPQVCMEQSIKCCHVWT